MSYQIYAVLITILDMCAMFVVLFLVTGSLLAVGDFVKRIWRHLRRESRLDYERYRAEEALRNIKRRAVYELLTAERAHRDQIEHYADVIEGTAVEVRR